MVRCPTCGTEVQPDWDWCHVCGWDPEGLRPAAWTPAAAGPGPSPRPTHTPPPPMAPPPAAHRFAPEALARPGAPAGYAPPPPAPARSGTSSALLIIGSIVGGVFLVAVVCILAVTFLGRSTPTSKFASVDGAITLPEDEPADDGPIGVTEQNADLDAAVWETWTAPDGSYRVDFPAPPAIESNPLEEGIVTDEFASAELASTGYLSYHLALSPDYELPDPSETLGLTLDLIGESAGITYSSRTPGSFDFLPSLSFTGSVENGQGTVQGVAFASDRQVYALITIAYDGVLVDHERFLASFATG